MVVADTLRWTTYSVLTWLTCADWHWLFLPASTAALSSLVCYQLMPYTVHTLVHAFVASRIDYCNAVLYGVTDTAIRRLQAVLYAAARPTERPQHANIADTLHWLPMSQRIIFRIVLMTYDGRPIRGRSAAYISVTSVYRLSPFPFARSRLGSADKDDMIVPCTRTVSYGSQFAQFLCPHICNTLPFRVCWLVGSLRRRWKWFLEK